MSRTIRKPNAINHVRTSKPRREKRTKNARRGWKGEV